MIKVNVDEAAAFDMLSILQIKANKSETDLHNYITFLEQISKQIDFDMVGIILKSDEYERLLTANQAVFNIIEKIHIDKAMSAEFVHDANMKRFYAKKELQRLFFSNGLTELKTVR